MNQQAEKEKKKFSRNMIRSEFFEFLFKCTDHHKLLKVLDGGAPTYICMLIYMQLQKNCENLAFTIIEWHKCMGKHR